MMILFYLILLFYEGNVLASNAGTERAEHIQIMMTSAREADNVIPTQDRCITMDITYGSESLKPPVI